MYLFSKDNRIRPNNKNNIPFKIGRNTPSIPTRINTAPNITLNTCFVVFIYNTYFSIDDNKIATKAVQEWASDTRSKCLFSSNSKINFDPIV